jgi:thiol reductant ABC exporter CydC subunit
MRAGDPRCPTRRREGIVELWSLRPERLVGARALVLAAITSLSGIGLAASSAWLIVRSAQRPGVFSLAVAMGLVQLFALARAGSRYLERLFTHSIALEVIARLRLRCFSALERLIPGGLGPRADRELVEVVLEDAGRVEHLLVSTLSPVIAAATASAGALVLAGFLSGDALALLLAACLALGVLLPAIHYSSSLEPTVRLERSQGRRSELVDTLFRSGLELSTSPALAAALVELERCDAELAAARVTLARRRGLVAAAAALVSGATVVALFELSATRVADGAIGLDAIAVLPLVAIALFETVSALVPSSGALARDLAAIGRLSRLSTAEPPIAEPEHPAELLHAASSLRTSGLAVGFEGAPALLEEVSLDLHRGGVTALTGPSGSGKSALADVLARFLALRAGEVLLDGRRFEELSGPDVRARVITMDQDPHLFHTTLEDNLRVARPDATESELRKVVGLAGLAPLVERHPAGLRLEVGEEGSQLSGGERRRVALARVLLASPRVAVLDEPTEGLDESGAKALLDGVLLELEEAGILLITHRPSEAARATQWFEVEAGRLHLREVASAGEGAPSDEGAPLGEGATEGRSAGQRPPPR